MQFRFEHLRPDGLADAPIHQLSGSIERVARRKPKGLESGWTDRVRTRLPPRQGGRDEDIRIVGEVIGREGLTLHEAGSVTVRGRLRAESVGGRTST